MLVVLCDAVVLPEIIKQIRHFDWRSQQLDVDIWCK